MKVKASVKSKGIFEKISERVNSVGAFGVQVKLAGEKKESYADVFLDLMKRLDNTEIKIIIMIDEFPSTVENIHQKSGKVEAVHLLKLNRTIRQESAGGIQFVYTGSIGLPAVVNRLNTPESINDLNPVEISPLSNEEGRSFVEQLLKSAKVSCQSEAIDYLLEKINWLMPFFIQLSVQELIDLFDKNQAKISKEVIDKAFENICNHRNNTHFDSYYNRLEDAFSAADYKLAINVLNFVAANASVSEKELSDHLKLTGSTDHLNPIIESLIYDGYINLKDGYYRFNSPILQLWWNKYGRKL